MYTKVIACLEYGLSELKTKGWIQGEYCNKSGVCAAGALGEREDKFGPFDIDLGPVWVEISNSNEDGCFGKEIYICAKRFDEFVAAGIVAQTMVRRDDAWCVSVHPESVRMVQL